jgi:GNAT superfamily N-acetyltransferase
VKIVPLDQARIADVEELLRMGAPYVSVRTRSDYWLYASLFSSTCPIAIEDNLLAGVVIAFRSQDDPDEVYVQDVMVNPLKRHRGVARQLLAAVRRQAEEWGCRRIYLTSEADNIAAHSTWLSLDFTNIPGDRDEGGVSVISDYKGPGKHRAVYEQILPS